MALWFKDGKLVMSGGVVALNCPDCPCGGTPCAGCPNDGAPAQIRLTLGDFDVPEYALCSNCGALAGEYILDLTDLEVSNDAHTCTYYLALEWCCDETESTVDYDCPYVTGLWVYLTRLDQPDAPVLLKVAYEWEYAGYTPIDPVAIGETWANVDTDPALCQSLDYDFQFPTLDPSGGQLGGICPVLSMTASVEAV